LACEWPTGGKAAAKRTPGRPAGERDGAKHNIRLWYRRALARPLA
jgi:hypothetical protein